ncbi:MAG: hypothetical protein LF888_03905 [Candidatus Megaira endosymbiont of Mesostigma viride]|jgi:hypothetical protein|nr:hypothetical protein [Alphaproteobacteria bacterium]UCM93646.1 MAG: hypothetical protein LF888_03905 [Candidatus Megaira endosymbiont of Mesostigma viride]HJK88737.1 hypothetical protein [Candidatus Megaira endosymbiont of Mesostigma viride]
MTLTIPSPQISNARTIPVVPIPVTASTWGEINVPTNTSVIAPVLLVTNLEAVDLATSGPAVNILGEEQDAEGSYVHNLPEIFTSFSE